MITEDLITYIQEKRRKNISDTEIASRLSKAGWHSDDIKEGFNKINPPMPTESISNISVQASEIETSQKSDPYRELPELEVKKDIEEKILPKVVMPPIVPLSQNKIMQDVRPTSPAIQPLTQVKVETPVILQPEFKKEDFIPALIPKIEEKIQPEVKAPFMDNLPKSAILSSYSQDLSNATMLTEETVPSNKHRLLKWIIIILVLGIIGGGAFAIFSGNMKLPAFSFIKKDPKAVIANMMLEQNQSKSYKVETNVNISIPSFANITNGLLSGATVSSLDKDNISVHAKGIVGQSSSTPAVEYAATIKGSFMKNDIVTNVKHDGINSYVTVPDLHFLIGDMAPEVGVVAIPNGQMGPILGLLPNTFQEVIAKIDIYKLATNIIPAKTIVPPIKDFIENTNVIDKGEEDILGVPTYHYELQASRDSAKTIMNSIVEMYISDLSPNQRVNIEEAVGSTTLRSLEVWIGKGDNIVHQYKVSLAIPLGKVLGLEDKGISGSEVRLDWQSAYYDFDISNNIEIPKDAISLTEFIYSINDLKIKNLVSLLDPSAKVLKNAEGSFGPRANSNGSCINPSAGSLFSPLGHKKGATTAVGSIADIMNKILNITGGAGACFSTSTAWAAAFPLSDAASSLCVDSTGMTKTLTSPLAGTLCK